MTTIATDDIMKLVGAELLKVNDAPSKRLDVFFPGLYVRQLMMAPNCVYLTEKHKTIHPFFVNFGKISVWTEEKGWELYMAPHFGMTVPGTQRFFRTWDKEVLWVTVHANDIIPSDDTQQAFAEAVKAITDKIIEPTDLSDADVIRSRIIERLRTLNEKTQNSLT